MSHDLSKKKPTGGGVDLRKKKKRWQIFNSVRELCGGTWRTKSIKSGEKTFSKGEKTW